MPEQILPVLEANTGRPQSTTVGVFEIVNANPPESVGTAFPDRAFVAVRGTLAGALPAGIADALNGSYDAAGNVTSDNIHSYGYDDRGRLVSVDSGAVTYAHNGQGQRVLKDDGSESLFAYDEAGQLIGEYDEYGAAIQETVWFNGAPVAVLVGSDKYYVHTDHLGTPRAISDGNTVIWRWESDPFGSSAPQEDPDGDLTPFTYNLRFPGQYYDQETGLHYNYYRTYDPSTGRYLESDPIGLVGGLNTYGYADQSPLMYDDPLGLSPGSRAADYLKCVFKPEAMTRGECGQKLAESAAKETAADLVDLAKDTASEAQQCAAETARCTWRVLVGDDAASIAANGFEEYVELRTRQTLKAVSKKAYKKFIPVYNAFDSGKDIYLVYVCVTEE